MKKKLCIVVYLFFVYYLSFTQNIQYRVTKDCNLNSFTDGAVKLKKGILLNCNESEVKFFVNDEQTKDYKLLIYPLFTELNNGMVGYDKYLELSDSIKLFENNFIELIPVYYLDILNKKDSSLIYKYQNRWNEYKNRYKSIEGESFEFGFWPETILISNLYMTFTENNHYLTKKISKNEEYYKLHLINQKDYYEDTVPMPENFVKNADKKEIFVLLKFDGDYVDLWINSPSQENYMGKYFSDIDRTTLWEIKMLIRGKNFNLSNIYWPRHADGTSDFDKEIKPPIVHLVDSNNTQKTSEVTTSLTTTVAATNVSIKKVMSVTENLKLRSGEAITTSVLTVMSAGTKVKILELGKAETIDGINSNWVKVEVQKGAKDRDGKEIKAGTVGWCYGSYLK